MPELPEVEVIARVLSREIVGRVVDDVLVKRSDLRVQIQNDFASVVRGARVVAVYRRAKYVVLLLDNDGSVVVHLGMSGRLLHVLSYTISKHDHVVFVLDDGSRVVFNDPRRFGLVVFVSRDESTFFGNCILEPLSEHFSADYLFGRLGKRAIKPLLMSGTVVVGIGNIYASEILFRSAILPYRIANSLCFEECEKVVKETKFVLEYAIKVGGSTIRDYVMPSGMRGDFQRYFMVYQRVGEPCYVCGSQIQTIKQSGRSTFFCVQCQK